VIVGQANTNFDSLTELTPEFKTAIENNDYLLLQKEIPMEIDVLAAQYAKSKGKTVILDCGGRDDPIPEELLQNLDYISPNQTELARLDPTINLDDIVNEVRNKLISKYPKLKVLLKEGS
jgi:ribokinase